MADIRDILKRQLGTQGKGVAGALPGATARALEDKLRGGTTPTAEAERAALYADTDVYLVVDGTGSMDYLISAVREGVTAIGTELFSNPDKGQIQVGISVVRDHKDPQYFVQGALRRDPRQLETDIAAITCFGGSDLPEAYECAWLDLARAIPQYSAQRKRVVVFAGDTLPHGLVGDGQRQTRIVGVYDDGCPNGIDYRTAWRALTTAANLTLFVGCHQEGGYHSENDIETAQRSIVDSSKPDQKYIPLAQIGDIPTLVQAATRLVQSPTAVRDYITRLQLTDSGKAGRIAGYLGVGK